jgi:hypothetical protein
MAVGLVLAGGSPSSSVVAPVPRHGWYRGCRWCPPGIVILAPLASPVLAGALLAVVDCRCFPLSQGPASPALVFARFRLVVLLLLLAYVETM